MDLDDTMKWLRQASEASESIAKRPTWYFDPSSGAPSYPAS